MCSVVCLQAVRAFFRTNRSTCVEWLLRVRLLLIQIAEAAGQHATVLHHAYLLLQVRGSDLFYMYEVFVIVTLSSYMCRQLVLKLQYLQYLQFLLV